jgi:hypothetical protein
MRKKMPSLSDDIARSAAQRLSAELDRNLPAMVEAELRGGKPPERFEPLALAIAFAALVVSASQLAWNVYRDLKKERKAAPDRDLVARQLRLEIKLDGKVTEEQRDKIIAVVVDEMVKGSSDI